MNEHEQKQINLFFKDLFGDTLRLSERLIDDTTNPQEVLTLLCARLDAMSCNAYSPDEPRRRAFTKFVTGYGGYKSLLEKVSVGDLFSTINLYRWKLRSVIKKPGKVTRFRREDDVLIHLINVLGIEITRETIEELFDLLSTALVQRYKVKPKQPAAKSLTCSTDEVCQVLASALRGWEEVDAQEIENALTPLVVSKTLINILYDVRSDAIHGSEVPLEKKRFFCEQLPYWHAHGGFLGPSYEVEFPAPFLLGLLKNSIRTYQHAVISRRCLPLMYIFKVFRNHAFEHLHLVDKNSFGEEKTLRLKLPDRIP